MINNTEAAVERLIGRMKRSALKCTKPNDAAARMLRVSNIKALCNLQTLDVDELTSDAVGVQGTMPIGSAEVCNVYMPAVDSNLCEFRC